MTSMEGQAVLVTRLGIAISLKADFLFLDIEIRKYIIANTIVFLLSKMEKLCERIY